jgi:hypothetical protein
VKPTVFRAAALSLFLALAATARAESPAIPITKAIELAQQALVAKGRQNEVFVQSASLQRGSILNSNTSWIVTWSHTIPGQKEGSQEYGVEIDMKGNVVHLIKVKGKAPNTPH